MSRFIQVDCHLKDKPEVVEMRMLLGMEDNAQGNAAILGPLVLLWSYAQVHAEKDGRIKMRWEFMPKMFGGTAEIWDALKEVGWITYENGEICVSKWEETFYSKTPAGRSKKYRDDKKETNRAHASARERTQYPREQNDQNAAPRIEENRVEEIRKEESRIEETAPAGTATRLNEFWTNLTRAGMPLDAKQPYWLRQAMNNGQGELLLAASREIGNTKFLEGDNPTTLANFNPKTPKAQAWLERLAGGEFSSGGKIAVPEGKPQKEVFPPAGKKMTPGEAKEWVNESDGNRHAYEVWRERSRRDTGRDSSRGEPVGVDVEESQADIVTEPVQRPTLRDANEDFSTKAAQAAALNQIASWSEENGKD